MESTRIQETEKIVDSIQFTRHNYDSFRFMSPNGEVLRLVMQPTKNDLAENASHWFMYEDNVDRGVFYTMSEVVLINDLKVGK